VAAIVKHADVNSAYRSHRFMSTRPRPDGTPRSSDFIVASDPTFSFATVRVVGGLVFTLGLALVLVGGAELFTGNNLIVMAWASGKVSTRTMLRNWTIVWFGNLLGALGLIVLVFFSHHLDMNDGLIGLSVLNTAAGKIRPDMVTLFFKGILCNVLVCAAVWLAYAGRSVTDKMIAVILPVSAFIAAGFEHCVANMYFLPLAWLLVQTGHIPANFDTSTITITGIIHNLIPVTLGNVVGGAGFVGAVYWAIYRAAFGASYQGENK
jgi:formate transporter